MSTTMDSSSVASSSSPRCDEENDAKPPARNDHHRRRRSSSSNNNKNREAREDLITVFQAAPLVWFSEHGAHPMKAIDFEYEREVLSRIFREACAPEFPIHVEYEIATTDRLGVVLAKGEGRILHFSCHGHPTFLALEDGWGDLTRLEAPRLQEWISAGGQNLQFVFVLACNSALIGDAFVRAGVPHVICCRIDSMLREDAAVEFEKSFYLNLACGHTLLSAFELARHQVLNCHHIPAEDRQNEINKYCLLPLDSDHDVEVFYQPPLPPTPRQKRHVPSAVFPLPPMTFIGRELDQYHVLQALKRGSRLVRVTGGRGVGKSALVKSCCHYLNERLHVVNLHEILWIPYHRRHDEMPYSAFEKVFDAIKEHQEPSNGRTPSIPFLGKARQFIAKLVKYFDARRTVLVIEATHFASNRDVSRLCEFIEELLRKTRHVKIIVIHQADCAITTRQSFVLEESISVGPLDFHSSLTLFEHLCPHRHLSPLPPHLCRTLELQVGLSPNCNPPRLNKRLSDIFDMIGKGIPTEIHKKANRMDLYEYQRLVSLVQQDDGNTTCCSRAEVLTKQALISDEISKAKACQDFSRAGKLQILYDNLEAQKLDFLDIAELQQQFDEVTYQRELAVSARDWASAQRLQDELDSLDTAIKMESDVEDKINDNDAQVLQTRASLEAKLLQLDDDYEKAVGDNNFPLAREIDAESQRLKNVRSQKPSRADYTMKVYALQSELENAKAERKLDAAEIIHKRLVEVKTKLKLEEDAEAALGISVPAAGRKQHEGKTTTPTQQCPATSGAQHRQSTNSESQTSIETTQSADPPGYAPVVFREERLKNPGCRKAREKEKAQELYASKRPTTRRPLALERQPVLRDSSSDEDSDEYQMDSSPGAIRVTSADDTTMDRGEIDSLDDSNDTATIDATTTLVTPADEAAGTLIPSLGGYVAKAELVHEQLSLEQAILDTLRKNIAQQAVDITREEERGRKGFGKFFHKWGKKKK